MSTPPGYERPRHGVEAVPRGEHVEHDPVDVGLDRGVSARSPTVSRHAGCGPPKNVSTLAAGDVGEVLASLVRRHQTVVADGPQQRHGQRARTRRPPRPPGRRGRCPPCARPDRRPWGRRRRHRAASTARSRPAAGAARGRSRPPVVVIMVPSGPPISSSCWIDPLWVWNSLPATRVIVCIRPFGSVSCTRSPTANGPRRCAAPVGSVLAVSVGVSEGSGTVGKSTNSPREACSGGAGEGALDVRGREHAVDVAVGFDDEVLAGRVRCQRRRPAPRPQGRPAASSSGRQPPAQVADRHPGLPLARVRRAPAPRRPGRPASPDASTTTRPRAPARCAWRIASASGRSAGTGIARRVSAAGATAREPAAARRPAGRLAGADPDEGAEQRAPRPRRPTTPARGAPAPPVNGAVRTRRRGPGRPSRPPRCRCAAGRSPARQRPTAPGRRRAAARAAG